MKLAFLFLFFSQILFAQENSGEIRGTVVDKNGEGIPFVTVYMYEGDSLREALKGAASTDFDGHFVLKPVPTGTYNLKFDDRIGVVVPTYISTVVVEADRITFFEKIEMEYAEMEGESYGVPNEPLIRIEQFGNKTTIEGEEIRRHCLR